MHIKLMLLLLLLLLLRIMGIKHFYDFSFKKDYSILYEIRKGKKQGHEYSLTQKFFASSHTPHPNFPQVPPPLPKKKQKPLTFCKEPKRSQRNAVQISAVQGKIYSYFGRYFIVYFPYF